MTVGFVVEHTGMIYAAMDSSETCFQDPNHFMSTKLLWINKGMLMLCAGQLAPLKNLRDIVGSYQNRVVTLESAADFIVDWLDKLCRKEQDASYCLLCGYDPKASPVAFQISKLPGCKATKASVDIQSTKSIGHFGGEDPAVFEQRIDQAVVRGVSPYQAMSEVIYSIIALSSQNQAPVVHEIIRPV